MSALKRGSGWHTLLSTTGSYRFILPMSAILLNHDQVNVSSHLIGPISPFDIGGQSLFLEMHYILLFQISPPPGFPILSQGSFQSLGPMPLNFFD